jgi:hypothetical protein
MVRDDIAPFCVDRLRDAYNPATALFDRQLHRGRWEPTQGAEGLTSTAIALIGLSRSGITFESIGVDLERTRAALVAGTVRPRALGLLYWSSCVTGGPGPAELLRPGTLSELAARTGRLQTMELAWLVSGLAHGQARAPAAALRAALRATRDALRARFEAPARTFRHATEDAPIWRWARRWIANFADQIYSIQALALTVLVERDARSLEVAALAAEHLADVQGPLGQWWWHYNARDGRVAQAYPVYSVHQYGMAPMALRTLTAAGGPSFGTVIGKSRGWVNSNELGVSLLDRGVGTIWRDIERGEGFLTRQARRARAVLGGRDDGPADPSRLTIRRETRPYEWAWYLFAAALDGGRPAMHHLI